MGDFGPAYMSSSRPTAQLYRCDDCSVTIPAGAASDDALCPSCGGTLRSLGVGGAYATQGSNPRLDPTSLLLTRMGLALNRAPPDVSALTGGGGGGFGGGAAVSAEEMASVVLSEILSPGLLESLGALAEAPPPSLRQTPARTA